MTTGGDDREKCHIWDGFNWHIVPHCQGKQLVSGVHLGFGPDGSLLPTGGDDRKRWSSSTWVNGYIAHRRHARRFVSGIHPVCILVMPMQPGIQGGPDAMAEDFFLARDSDGPVDFVALAEATMKGFP